MTNLTKVFELISYYYKIKNEYTTKYNELKKKKKKLNYKNLNDNEMRKEIKNIKMKCIHCKKNGGNIFKEDGNIIDVKCNAKKKCDFHIRIRLGKYKSFDAYKTLLKKEIEDYKNKIIKLKLDLLFKLEKENVVLGEFNMIKEELTEKQTLLSKIQTIFDKNNNINDTSDDNEPVLINRKNTIKNLSIRMNNEINDYNDVLKKFKEEGENENNINILKDALNIYIENIIPLMEKKQEISFQTYEILEKKINNKKNSFLEYKVYSKFISDLNKEIELDDSRGYKILINKK